MGIIGGLGGVLKAFKTTNEAFYVKGKCGLESLFKTTLNTAPLKATGYRLSHDA